MKTGSGTLIYLRAGVEIGKCPGIMLEWVTGTGTAGADHAMHVPGTPWDGHCRTVRPA